MQHFRATPAWQYSGPSGLKKKHVELLIVGVLVCPRPHRELQEIRTLVGNYFPKPYDYSEIEKAVSNTERLSSLSYVSSENLHNEATRFW
jgi:hypothetical protein